MCQLSHTSNLKGYTEKKVQGSYSRKIQTYSESQQQCSSHRIATSRRLSLDGDEAIPIQFHKYVAHQIASFAGAMRM